MGSDPRSNRESAGITSHSDHEGVNGSQANGVRVRTAGLWHGAAERLQSVLAAERDSAHAAVLAESSHFSQPSHDDEQHAMPRVIDARMVGLDVDSRSEEESTGQSRSTGSALRSHLTRDMVQE